MSRVVWLAAGAAAGAYATVKGRRAAYRLSVPGLVDQAAALGTGWREFRAEVATGMSAREDDLIHQLDAPRAKRATATRATTTRATQSAIESDHTKDHRTS